MKPIAVTLQLSADHVTMQQNQNDLPVVGSRNIADRRSICAKFRCQFLQNRMV